MGTPKLDAFLRALTRERRVLLLGGLAIIAHGLSRATKDADIWLEPMESGEAWADLLFAACARFPETRLARLPGWTVMETAAEVAMAAEEIGMVRVLGLECPLDVFRRPNEFEESAFDEVWSRATVKEDGVHLPDAADLLQSKHDTGRERDAEDIHFLEAKLRRVSGEALPTASLAEAEAIFARYVDHAVAARALENPDPAVQALARQLLAELAEQGDPFARDALGL